MCKSKNNTQENKMLFTSAAFSNESMIPSIYTCDGMDISPQLAWKNVPLKTETLALIMEDPVTSHGIFVHWVAWNIDPKVGELPTNASKNANSGESPTNAGENTSSVFMRQGHNSANGFGYKGPCPPTGILNISDTHTYNFKLYALDKKLTLPPTIKKNELLAAMKGHILGEAMIMGKYKKMVKN
jgi:Raf kinase inhibitor-like YbhB/YbcL family protein